MSYSASGLPSGLGINSSTGLISGMLSSGDSSNSPYTVTVTANDGTSSSSQTFAWNVSVINLVAPGDQTNNDGDTVSLPLTTGYHGSGTLSYSATGLPPGLSINSSTGQITGKITGTADTSSPYSVTVSVTDGTNTTSQSFNWAINAVVSIVALDDQSNAAGDAVSLQVAASDALNNTLTYSATNLPAGLSINSTSGLIGGTIAVGADGGSPYAVTITVTDSAGNSASLSFNWTVMHVSLVNPGPLWNVDGQSVSLQLQGHDSDGDKVSYTASGLPGGLSISTSTGLISGIIASNADTNSPYNVTLTAGDGAHTTTQTFLWTVSQVALTLPSDQTNTEGDNVSLQLQGTASTGSLSYNASGLPAGLSLNPATGLISGILASGDAANGPYTVNASVNNGKDSTSQSFNWTINPVVNLTAPVDQSNSVGNNVSLQISTTDTLHRTLTYSAAGLPSGLNVNSSTGLISGTITGGDPNGGPYVVTVTAADGIYSSSASFNWNVTDTAALTVTAPGTQDNVASDSVVNLQVRASDPDGDALTFSTTNLPDGLTIDPITGIISGSIADDAAGPAPYQTTVTATDGNGQSVSQTFTWIVNAPPIVAQAMPLNFTEGIDPGPFTIATFTTPDLNSLPDDFGAIITYGDGTTDSGAISGGNGSFTVTTDHIYAEKGTYPVSIQIFNGLTGGSTTTSTTATVADAALTLTGFQLGDPGDDLQTSFVVGYLTDANPDATIADFSETINTGTGLLMGRNYLEQIGPGRFLVILPQGYPTPYPNTNMQTYSVSVSVTDVDGDSVSSSSEIDAGLIVADVPATMTNWVFEDLNSNATAGEFNITVDWGDGTSSPDQAIFFAGGNGNPTIWGLAAVTHTYVQDSYDQPNGRYQITVTITSSDGDLTGIQYVSVMRSPLQQYTGNVNIASNLTVSNAEVAVFTVADSLDPVSEFTAQIDWGDGTTGSGTIQELAPGLYQVVGSHTYATYDWYTLTVTISQSWQAPVGADRGVGIVGGKPIVEILNPFPLKSLKVSKWETAFQRVGTTQPPESMPILRLRHDFPLGDNASFFLDVKDQAAASKTSINVHVSTSSDPAGHDIVLRNIFGGNGPGWFSSLTLPGGGWLLLTSVAADKTQLGNAGFMVKLGDTIRATYDGQEATATVPVKKRVNLHINVLRLTRGGNPVATRGKVNGDVNWANQIYAQVGIRFDVEGPINFVNPPPGVNLGNGLTVTFPGLAAEQRALLESYRTPADNDIDMYYVNRMVFLGGAPGPIGFAYPADIYNGLNARYADSIIIGADFEVYTTLAHEIAHILLNPGLPHPNPRVWGVNIVNVLSVPYWVNGWVTDSRRITANQDREMLNGPNSRKNLLLNP